MLGLDELGLRRDAFVKLIERGRIQVAESGRKREIQINPKLLGA